MKNRSFAVKALMLLVFVSFLPSCAGKANLDTVNRRMQMAVTEGEGLIKSGKVEEGLVLVQFAEKLHPNDSKIKAILGTVSKEKLASLKVNPMLGYNQKQLRAPFDASTAQRVLFWPIDRVKDMIDIFSIDVNFGPQIGAGVWYTRALQAVAYVGGTTGIGYHQKTTLGLRIESSFDLAVGPVGATAIAGVTGGLTGYSATARAVAMHKPTHDLYQEYRDYWAFGGKIGFILVGLEVEFHPIEIADFFAGLALIDFLKDDFATTRRLKYDSEHKALFRRLSKGISSMGEDDMSSYKSKYPTLFPAGS